ncbi:hypothetical protein B0H13DRAFT_1923277 [Mycena leptocephala]|nr:hypothetical protein B0H13DRAFT_1923277 [Mycena leptocephala]
MAPTLTLARLSHSDHAHNPGPSDGTSFIDTPSGSAIPLLPNRRKGQMRKSELYPPPSSLPTLCMVLHFVLAILYIVLLIICVPHLEHWIVFPLARQSLISPALSGILTTFAARSGSDFHSILQLLAAEKCQDTWIAGVHEKYLDRE